MYNDTAIYSQHFSFTSKVLQWKILMKKTLPGFFPGKKTEHLKLEINLVKLESLFLVEI